jgi:hypothetical protein
MTKFSKRFLEFVGVKNPQLASLFREATDKDGNPTGFALAEIPAPNTNAASPLWITTEDDEITIGFDAYHQHFGPWAEENESVNFEDSLLTIERIRNDELVVASWWLDGKWTGSILADFTQQIDRPNFVSESAMLQIRSWTGKKDNKK